MSRKSNGQINDQLLEALLEESLGGRRPPDLSERILAAHAERSTAAARSGVVEPPPVEPAARHTPGTNGSVAGAYRRRKRRVARTWRFSAAAAASVLLIGGVLGAVLFQQLQENREASQFADRKDAPNHSTEIGADDNQSRETQHHASPDPDPPHPALTPRSPHLASQDDDSPSSAPADENQPGGPQVAEVEEPYRGVELASDAEIAALIDESIAKAWNANDVRPSPPAGDAEWARRAFLRLLGRIPTVEELEAFVNSNESDKRQRLVEKLLNEEKYAEQFARHWSAYWANVLIGRSGGEQDDLASRAGLEQYLRRAFYENKPYDQIVRELLTAIGSGEPGAEDYNGAANFFIAALEEDDEARLATSRVSEVFLGQRLKCAQCHNHPFKEWRQHQFWEMNAFLRQMRLKDEGESGPRLVERDFRGKSGDADEAEVYFEQFNGEMKVAYPTFLDGREIPKSGRLAEVNRRRTLAEFVTHSETFSRAAVNRVWSHFFGYGFTRPIDDMGSLDDASHPELLDRLGEQFAAHNYDLKQLMRWITLSEPFGLSSRTTEYNLADAPSAGTPLFSRYYTRQLQPEAVYDSLRIAAHASPEELAGGDADRRAWLGQFSHSLDTDEGDEVSTFDGSIPQSLTLMNGPLMQRATDADGRTLLARVADSDMTTREKIEHLFLAALSREPTKRELRAIDQLLRNRRGDSKAALQDIWWALLNSNEFILDH